MISCPYTVGELLSHAPPMILIDEAIGIEDKGFVAAVNIGPQSRFFVPGQGVPAHVGLEYMAQTCGLYAGFASRRRNEPVRIGFLLGTRNFHAAVDWFASGARLIVRACETFCETPMGVFDCSIACDGLKIATATLNVYQPREDVRAKGVTG